MIYISLRSNFEQWAITRKEYFPGGGIKVSSVFEDLDDDRREKGVIDFEHKLIIMQIEAWNHGHIDVTLLEVKNKKMTVRQDVFENSSQFKDCISRYWFTMNKYIFKAETSEREKGGES